MIAEDIFIAEAIDGQVILLYPAEQCKLSLGEMQPTCTKKGSNLLPEASSRKKPV